MREIDLQFEKALSSNNNTNHKNITKYCTFVTILVTREGSKILFIIIWTQILCMCTCITGVGKAITSRRRDSNTGNQWTRDNGRDRGIETRARRTLSISTEERKPARAPNLLAPLRQRASKVKVADPEGVVAKSRDLYYVERRLL